jgi:hypothetical protein
MKSISNLKKFTVEQFQSNFDDLFQEVKNGESYIIESEYGNAVIIPYSEISQILKEYDLDPDIIKIYTDHEEGS